MALACSVTNLLVGVFLILGVNSSNPSYLTPYLVWSPFYFVVLIASFSWDSIQRRWNWALFGQLLAARISFLVITTYLWICVWTHKKRMISDRQQVNYVSDFAITDSCLVSDISGEDTGDVPAMDDEEMDKEEVTEEKIA